MPILRIYVQKTCTFAMCIARQDELYFYNQNIGGTRPPSFIYLHLSSMTILVLWSPWRIFF